MNLQSNIQSQHHEQSGAVRTGFMQGAQDILPLAIAVMPWGVLAGSLAIQTGLSAVQSFAMSALMFAGAAQLVSLNLVAQGVSTLTVLSTIFFLTSQHLIYALNFRQDLRIKPIKQRLIIGFLLTDELFAVGVQHKHQRSFAYLLGAGVCFYSAWLLFSLLGILVAQYVTNISLLHLDFSVVALLILIIVPLVKNLASLVGVGVTFIMACILKYQQIEASLIISGLCGMCAAVLVEKIQKRWETKS